MGCIDTLADISKEYRITDWITGVVLILTGFILGMVPFPDDFEEYFNTDISEPWHTQTMSYWIVFTGEFFVIPLLIFLIVLFVVPDFSKNKILCAYFCALGINLTVSNGLKRFVARPRPDTLAVCGGDGTYQRCKQVLTGLKLKDQFSSFPSSMTSEAVTALCFLSMFLSDVWTSSSLFMLVLRLFPFCLSLVVGASCIWDRMNHVDDVVAGYFIGILVTTCVYKVYKQNPKSA